MLVLKTTSAAAAFLLLQSCQTSTQQTPAKKDSVIGIVNTTPIVNRPATPSLADNVIKCGLRKGATLQMNTTYYDTAAYLAFDDNGDDYSFTVTHNNDTVFLIYNEGTNPMPLETGDQVQVEWQMNTYVPAGDETESYAAPFLKKYRLLKEGKTSQLKKKVKLQLLEANNNLTTSFTEQVSHIVWNYLANTSDPAVKQALQNSGTEMGYAITREKDKEEYPYTITLSTTGAVAATVKELYFDYNSQYILLEKSTNGEFIPAL